METCNKKRKDALQEKERSDQGLNKFLKRRMQEDGE